MRDSQYEAQESLRQDFYTGLNDARNTYPIEQTLFSPKKEKKDNKKTN